MVLPEVPIHDPLITQLLHVRLDGYHLLKEQLLHSGSSDESEEEEEEGEQEICLAGLKQKEMDFLERSVTSSWSHARDGELQLQSHKGSLVMYKVQMSRV